MIEIHQKPFLKKNGTTQNFHLGTLITELSMAANLPRGLNLKRTLFQIIYCKRLSPFELCLLLLLLNSMASRFCVSNFLPALTGTRASQVQTVHLPLFFGRKPVRPFVDFSLFFAPPSDRRLTPILIPEPAIA